MSCLGVFSRLTGQNRSPRPPAMMMTKRSVDPLRATGATDEDFFRDTGRDVAAGPALAVLVALRLLAVAWMATGEGSAAGRETGLAVRADFLEGMRFMDSVLGHRTPGSAPAPRVSFDNRTLAGIHKGRMPACHSSSKPSSRSRF